ncbi:MAG TPA: PilZ domain-containing protein [Marinagarivorans sp.]
MSSERRRYFRINDTVKLSYKIVRSKQYNTEDDTFDLIADQDRRMEVLIAEQKHVHPELIELIALLNQKIERLLQVEKPHKTTLAYHARNVNMSACGLSFAEQSPLDVGAHLRLFLVLDNDAKMEVEGLLVDCQQGKDDNYIWRIDFLNLREKAQETLIQHVVRRQSALLADLRENPTF